MVFRVQVLPISRGSTNVTVTTERTGSSPAFRYVGLWTDIRGFLAQHALSGVKLWEIETELHKDRPMSFDIDTSETGLSSAQFIAVKKL
jgi:hypothetical protein